MTGTLDMKCSGYRKRKSRGSDSSSWLVTRKIVSVARSMPRTLTVAGYFAGHVCTYEELATASNAGAASEEAVVDSVEAPASSGGDARRHAGAANRSVMTTTRSRRLMRQRYTSPCARVLADMTRSSSASVAAGSRAEASHGARGGQFGDTARTSPIRQGSAPSWTQS